MNFARESGVLLHPTSLPGPYGIGEFGPAAYKFADALQEMGQHLWQMLPADRLRRLPVSVVFHVRGQHAAYQL
jgi:4-alpha-glucanotransferase